MVPGGRRGRESTFSIAGDDLDEVHLNDLPVASEARVLENERPDLVAEPICVQMALEGGLRPRLGRECNVDGFVKLHQNLHRQLWV